MSITLYGLQEQVAEISTCFGKWPWTKPHITVVARGYRLHLIVFQCDCAIQIVELVLSDNSPRIWHLDLQNVLVYGLCADAASRWKAQCKITEDMHCQRLLHKVLHHCST
jgi:hypothetical protein